LVSISFSVEGIDAPGPSFHEMPSYDPEDPRFTGMTTEAIQKKEQQEETEALKQYGVHLKDNHLEGYRYQADRLDATNPMKPWEGDILGAIPSMPPICKSVEEWNNPECKFEIGEGIAYITLNRPAANNAMNGGITQGLQDAIYILQKRPDIRIAVLKAEGRMFCAGGDPKSFQAAQAGAGAIAGDGVADMGAPPGPHIANAAQAIQGNKMSAHSFAKLLYEFAALPQFTICCAQGSAMGGGFGLLCICDMVVAVKQAFFVLSEVKLGVIPATISPHVSGKIGVSNCKRLFCTAENCNMRMAKDMGLVQVVVDDASHFPRVIQEVASKLQLCGPRAVATTKETVLKLMHQPISESMIQWMAKEHARVRKSEEAEEGMRAIEEQTKPKWVDTLIRVAIRVAGVE